MAFCRLCILFLLSSVVDLLLFSFHFCFLFLFCLRTGMGEPLYNYRNLKTALSIIMDEKGLNYSKRSITVSTSGVVPAIQRLGRDLGVNLAISLHATTDVVRSELVPLNKTFNLALLMAACKEYPSSRRVTFEYVMLKGVNDSVEDAKQLIRLLHGTKGLVNLIPFNPWPGSQYVCSSNNTIYKFCQLVGEHLPVTIRWPRGRDIMAACGQLHNTITKKTEQQLDLQSKQQQMQQQHELEQKMEQQPTKKGYTRLMKLRETLLKEEKQWL